MVIYWLLLVNIVLTVLESSLNALRSLGVNVGTGEQLIFGCDLIVPDKPCMLGKFLVFGDL